MKTEIFKPKEFWRTIYEALVWFGLTSILWNFLTLLKLDVLKASVMFSGIGWASIPDRIIAGVIFSFIFPPLEEVLYRGIPIFLLRRETQEFSPRAIFIIATSCLFFAFSHVYFPSGFRFPIIQFLLGGWLFFVAYSRGLRYSILFHSVLNLFVVLLV